MSPPDTIKRTLVIQVTLRDKTFSVRRIGSGNQPSILTFTVSMDEIRPIH